MSKIHAVFLDLVEDKRFDGLSMALDRKVDYHGVLSYEIRVAVSAFSYRDDLDGFAAVNAALADFARAHDLDSEMNSFGVTFTLRGK